MHGDATLRAFVALELPAAARAAVAERIDALRGVVPDVRWVRPEALHVTLRFLGNVERERIAAIATALASALVGQAAFPLSLGAPALFPSARRPRVVALGLTPVEALAGLAARVERGVVAAGCAPEPRRFRAHLTLGRLRGRTAPPLAGDPPATSAFPVREAVLFESRLAAAGATYFPLERFSFGAPASP